MNYKRQNLNYTQTMRTLLSLQVVFKRKLLREDSYFSRPQTLPNQLFAHFFFSAFARAITEEAKKR